MPILRALAPIVANAGTAAASLAGMRTAANLKTDERIRALEEQLVRMAEVSSGLAKQTQAIAQELAAQERAAEVLEQKLAATRILAIAAICIAAVAVIVSRL